jgi:hypothetical protein
MNCTRRIATWPREQYETIRLSPTQIGSEKRGCVDRFTSTCPNYRTFALADHLLGSIWVSSLTICVGISKAPKMSYDFYLGASGQAMIQLLSPRY